MPIAVVLFKTLELPSEPANKLPQMRKIFIHLIAAARPNFMKIAPLFHALSKEQWAEPIIVHTGQHYDLNMSDAFFRDLGLPDPHIHLGVGSGTHAEQTGKVMMAYENVLLEAKPEMVIVVGDVNSTLACTLAAAKISYKQVAKQPRILPSRLSSYCGHRPLLAHLEAGLRSFDRTMPEEINRIVTDSLADILWTPSPDADENLLREGIEKSRIIRVGNIMIDSLEMMRDKIISQNTLEELGLMPRNYALVTLHRPSNVDEPDILKKLCRLLGRISENVTLVFPVHPRTRKNLIKYGLIGTLEAFDKVILLEPLSYVRFMSLVFDCRFVITDSGGIQEETTYLGIPCLTLRANTERPITITEGTNQLCDLRNIEEKVDAILSNDITYNNHIEFWDGKTARRVVDSIKSILFDAQ